MKETEVGSLNISLKLGGYGSVGRPVASDTSIQSYLPCMLLQTVGIMIGLKQSDVMRRNLLLQVISIISISGNDSGHSNP